MRLQGKTAIVTGGARGIGFAIAKRFVAEGASVALWDVLAEPLAEAKAKLSVNGNRVFAQQVDVTKESQIQTAVREGIRACGQIDILVNNAGVNPGLGLPFTRQVEADWDKVFDVNVKSVFFTCKAITPHFMERRAGKIVNIASIAGPLSSTTMPSYSVSKMGIITFTKIVAKELAPYNVNVNAICPGLLYTDMWKKIGEVIRETNPAYADLTPRQMFEKRVEEWIPMKREQTPEDIGHAAVFLASEEARNITGQALMVDGGVVM